MRKIKDQQLIDELQRRFNDNFQNLKDQNDLIKQLELVNQKLKESEITKTNFLSNIKNEINNPITSVLGLAQILLKDNSFDPTFIKKVASHIFSEVSNLDFQLRNIFSAAEIEAGEAALEISHVNVETLLLDVIEKCKIKYEPKNISIVLQVRKNKSHLKNSSSIHQFKTDENKLHLVLLNLLMNGIEFSPEGGQITVRVEPGKKNMLISFTDSGIGMNEEEKKEVFDRFKQGSSGMKKSYKGHGLGLAVTKGLVESLNGKLSVESAKSKGSSFAITFAEFDFSSPVVSKEDDELFTNHEKF